MKNNKRTRTVEEYNIKTGKATTKGVFAFTNEYIMFANKQFARAGHWVRFRPTKTAVTDGKIQLILNLQ